MGFNVLVKASFLEEYTGLEEKTRHRTWRIRRLMLGGKALQVVGRVKTSTGEGEGSPANSQRKNKGQPAQHVFLSLFGIVSCVLKVNPKEVSPGGVDQRSACPSENPRVHTECVIR